MVFNKRHSRRLGWTNAVHVKSFFFAMTFALSSFSVSAQWEDQSYAFSRWPVRFYGGRTFKLSPLISWWTNAEYLNNVERNYALRDRFRQTYGTEPTNAVSSKPLSAWCRVTGEDFQPHYLGWLVDGAVEDAPGHRYQARFILKNPPNLDRQRYHELRRELVQMQQNSENAASAALATREAANSDNLTGHIHDLVGHPEAAQVSYATAVRADQRQAGFQSQAETAGQRISQIKKSLAEFPPGNDYRLDVLAAKLGTLQDGSRTLILDMGSIPGTTGN